MIKINMIGKRSVRMVKWECMTGDGHDFWKHFVSWAFPGERD